MNLRAGWAVIRRQLLGFMDAKGFFWTLALGWMTGPVIYLLVWTAAVGTGTLSGYDRGDFVLYYLCLMLVNQLTYPTTHWSTAQSIGSGGISSALLRPMPIVYDAIACDMATRVVCMPFVLVVVLALGVAFGVQVRLTAGAALLSAGALLLAAAIRFLLAHTISLVAFWTQRSEALLSVNDTFVFLFAGQVAPLALFPGWLQQVARCLPYRYMVSFPVEALMGKLDTPALWQGFAVQALWLLALMGIHQAVYRRGVRRYSAVGG